jgi:hypothetical protein
LFFDLRGIPVSVIVTLVAIRILLGQPNELCLGLPLIKGEVVLVNHQKVRSVLNRMDFAGGVVDQGESQLAWLRIKLQHLFVVFEPDGCGEFDAIALRAILRLAM